MNERLLARLLSGIGLLGVGLLTLLGPSWSASGPATRAAFVLLVAAAVAGAALDVRHGHEARRQEGA